jgi:hypothetical protein
MAGKAGVHAQPTLLILAALTIPMVGAAAQQHGEMQMEMQPGAERMKVALQSPTDGSTITGDKIPLQVAVTGFQTRCDLAGKPNQQGTGHYHVLLDKTLVNMYCTDRATLSLAGVQPGRHTLTAVPAQNDHAEVEQNASSVAINYAPAHPQPFARPSAPGGRPTIKILSPRPGETVSGSYTVKIAVQNFTLTCDEMGKPDVPGHGHWHLNLDTMKGPMMGMMTMVAMSCETTLQASTAGLTPGSTHKVIALLADNAHAPVMPEVADSVEVKVK